MKTNETKTAFLVRHFSRLSVIILDEDHNRPAKTLSSDRSCVQKVDRHSRNSHELKFSMKSLTFSCLMSAVLIYYIASLRFVCYFKSLINYTTQSYADKRKRNLHLRKSCDL